jgi:hypothetical protein
MRSPPASASLRRRLQFGSASISHSGFAHLDQFDFVTFRSIDEGNAAAVGFDVWTIGVFQAEFFQVPSEFFEAVDFERQVRQIGLNLDGAAGRKVTKFDQLFTAQGLEESQFRTARRFVPANFLQTQNFFVKLDRAFEVIDAVTRVEEFFGLAHVFTIALILRLATNC